MLKNGVGMNISFIYFILIQLCVESGYILLTLELRVKRLRRFDLPPGDLDHAMIRVGDSSQVVVVAE